MIVIEGVVGVGKSSLMRHIQKLGYETFEEPVFDNPILEKFYYDRKRYSFPLQIFFLNKRFKHIKEASKIEKAVLDRSIYGDAIFAKLLHLNGEMEDEEYSTYEELLENMLEHVVPPKLMIYLEVSVDEAIRRIRKRGLDFEQIVEREYWQNLNDQYSSFFNQYSISPILKINVDNLDFEKRPEDLTYVLDLISKKLEELGV
ncbi:MAG TPA: deoxynucleoside kinase [Erysipelothrix sp.]|nr:deoxynucleoside kinase [Erysipelothrix sp.]